MPPNENLTDFNAIHRPRKASTPPGSTKSSAGNATSTVRRRRSARTRGKISSGRGQFLNHTRSRLPQVDLMVRATRCGQSLHPPTTTRHYIPAPGSTWYINDGERSRLRMQSGCGVFEKNKRYTAFSRGDGDEGPNLRQIADKRNL